MSTCIVGLQYGVLEVSCGKEGFCVEEGLSMEYASWSDIWRMSNVEVGESCSE